jgi:hypothetical protein
MAGVSGRFFPMQTIHLGQKGTFATFNEETLPYGGQLGCVTESGGKVYRLVQFDNGTGNVASVAGNAARWKTRASFIVTMDITDAEAGGVNDVAGGFLGALTDQYYGFVQIGGKQSLLGDGSVAKGELVSGGTSSDGEFDTWATTELPVAVAWGDDTGSPTMFDAYWLLGMML